MLPSVERTDEPIHHCLSSISPCPHFIYPSSEQPPRGGGVYFTLQHIKERLQGVVPTQSSSTQGTHTLLTVNLFTLPSLPSR